MHTANAGYRVQAPLDAGYYAVIYGNATQPGSRRIGDQLALLTRQEMRRAWWTRDELQMQLEDRTPIPSRR
jgi:hypothetical protein